MLRMKIKLYFLNYYLMLNNNSNVKEYKQKIKQILIIDLKIIHLNIPILVMIINKIIIKKQAYSIMGKQINLIIPINRKNKIIKKKSICL